MTTWGDTRPDMAPGEDYAGLTEALQSDWDLFDHHHWRSEIDARSGQALNGDELDRQARLAQAVVGEYPVANQVRTAAEVDAGAGRLTNPQAQCVQERDQNVWAMRGGTVSRLGWEILRDHR